MDGRILGHRPELARRTTKTWPMIAALLLPLAGCIGPFTRTGSEGDRDLDVGVVADLTDAEREAAVNKSLLQVSGAGLVTGLHGTGDAPQGFVRQILEADLRKQGEKHIRELLDDRDNAIVCVTAVLHAGMRKKEPLDVDIALPPGSRATSLAGGTLRLCTLREYQPVRAGPIDGSAVDFRLLSGDALAQAAGPLLIGVDDDARSPIGARPQAVDLKRARIWEGGIVLADRPFVLAMKPSGKPAHAANAVADRLNGLFRDDAQKIRLQNERFRQQNDVTQRLNQKFDAAGGKVAWATPSSIALNVPFAYCLNPERYLRVVKLVPVRESAEQQQRYRQRLAQMLQDSKDCVRAALRLEALGQDSVPVLRSGLESSQPLVRFASAEALTYLGSTAGAAELANAAQNHPQLRFWALLALANLNEAACRERLTELLDQPEPELRYGAFAALRLLSRSEARDQEEYVGGRWLGRFWLHHVSPTGPAMIHLNMSKREEIVLFGQDIRLRAAAGILAGSDFTITPLPGGKFLVSRVSLGEEGRQVETSPRIDEIILRMAQLGAQYPDVVDFLRKADQRHSLSCPLAVDARPTPLPMDELAVLPR